MTTKQKKLINKVLEYLWEDELRNYEENPVKGHIFETMQELEKSISNKG